MTVWGTDPHRREPAATHAGGRRLTGRYRGIRTDALPVGCRPGRSGQGGSGSTGACIVTIRRLLHLCLAMILLGAVLAHPGQAQETSPVPARTVKVALYINPPFVTRTETGFSGLAVELWESIADRLALKYEYHVVPKVSDLLQAVTTGQADIVVTNLTITRDRMRHMEFTQPWFDAGLRVMINEQRNAGLHDLLSHLSDSGHLRVYLWIGLTVLAATLVLTLIDRRFDPDFPHEWHTGMAHSFYHVISVVTSGRTSHKELWGAFGRVLSAVWMVVGVAVVAYVTSSVTSVMTANTLRSQISSVQDLSGKVVGTLRGSASEAVVVEMGLTIQPFDTLDSAVAALVARRISAIVDDAPTLEYYDATHPELPITEVGPLFHPSKYGFALPIHNPLRFLVSQEIVAAHENGMLERLRKTYFGTTP